MGRTELRKLLSDRPALDRLPFEGDVGADQLSGRMPAGEVECPLLPQRTDVERMLRPARKSAPTPTPRSA